MIQLLPTPNARSPVHIGLRKWPIWGLRGNKQFGLALVVLLVGCSGPNADGERGAEPVVAETETSSVDRLEPSTVAAAATEGGEAPESVGAKPLVDLLIDRNDQELLDAGPLPEGADGSAAATAPTRTEGDVPTGVAPVLANRAQLAEQGIRILYGKYVTVYTDLPESVAVNELPTLFDAAVPQWAQYFRVPDIRTEGWRVTARVMDKADHFQAAGLLPEDLPKFPFGYQQGDSFWIYGQPSDYYLRHIFLHEGTHAFMNNLMGGAGPAWYMEGVAELMATHLWQDKKLTLRYMPQSREEVPYWGRIKIIQDEFAAGRGLMLNEVMRLDHESFQQVTPYAWVWGAAAFLDGHPAYQTRFRSLYQNVQDRSVRFTRAFESELLHQLRQVDEEWQLFVMNADYGYDFARAAVKFKSGVPLPSEGAEVTVATDRGWQSTGYRLETGRAYRIESQGKFVLGREPQPWSSEPDGVTLHYYQGQPVGRLMGNVRTEVARPGIDNLGRPVAIGQQRVIQTEDSGTLYLRINESPAKLADNEGVIRVRLIPDPKAAADPPALRPGEAPDKTSPSPD